MPLERISAFVLNEDMITQSMGNSAVHTQRTRKKYLRITAVFSPHLKCLKLFRMIFPLRSIIGLVHLEALVDHGHR